MLSWMIGLVLAAAPAAGSPLPGQTAWAAFVTAPTAKNYQRVARRIESGQEQAPDSYTVTPKLVHLIEQRNRRAIGLGFLARNLLDGDDAEQVFKALGGVAEDEPALLLRTARQYEVSPSELARMVVMTPESTVDDSAGQRKILKRRLRSLATVKDPKFAELRDAAVVALKRELERL